MESYCQALFIIISSFSTAVAGLRPVSVSCSIKLETLWSITESHKCWLIMLTLLSYYCQYDCVPITRWNVNIYIAPFYVSVKKEVGCVKWYFHGGGCEDNGLQAVSICIVTSMLAYWCSKGSFSYRDQWSFMCPDNEGSRFLWNGGFLAYNTASYPKSL